MGLRTREVRPGFWDNEELGECSVTARLLFVGLWSYADREGRFEARLRRIQASLFRYDLDIDLAAAFQELVDRGFVVLYEVEGRALACIPNFKKHQRLHPRETSSDLPGPPRLALGKPRCAEPSEPSEPSRVSPTETHVAPDKPEATSASESTSKPPFERFWDSYPRHEAKEAARKAFARAAKKKPAADIIAAAKLFAESPKGQGEFVPHAATWLNQGRYDDDPRQWHRAQHDARAGPNGRPRLAATVHPGTFDEGF